MFFNSLFNKNISKWNLLNVMHNMFKGSTLEKENNLPKWYIEKHDI